MDIDQIRRINLCDLEKMHGASALAKKAGMSPAQFYNLRDGAKDSKTGKPRGMRKETAWKLEDAAGVKRGYLDILHAGENAINKESPALSELDRDLLDQFHRFKTDRQQIEIIGYVKGKADELAKSKSSQNTRQVSQKKTGTNN